MVHSPFLCRYRQGYAHCQEKKNRSFHVQIDWKISGHGRILNLTLIVNCEFADYWRVISRLQSFSLSSSIFGDTWDATNTIDIFLAQIV
jgi:hypothetical protein